MKQPKITLEQWLTFKTVVDEGSFALAAEILNKSQSSVSYGIAQLNKHLPQPALVQQGRRAVLSAAGKVLYRRAEQLLREASDTESIAECLASGIQAEVSIAVDSLLNPESLRAAFEAFSGQFPHTRLRVLETTLSGTTEALLEKRADLVVGADVPVGFHGRLVAQVSMWPVAAPDHPLIEAGRTVTEHELRGHRQIVLRDSGIRRVQDSGWLAAEKRWTVSHFATAASLVKAGLGFAFLPYNWVHGELEAGSLRKIDLQPELERILPLYLLLADRLSADPATQRLEKLVRDCLHTPGSVPQPATRTP